MQLMHMFMLRRLMVVMVRVVVRVRLRRIGSVECGDGRLRRLHGRMRQWGWWRWRMRSMMQMQWQIEHGQRRMAIVTVESVHGELTNSDAGEDSTTQRRQRKADRTGQGAMCCNRRLVLLLLLLSLARFVVVRCVCTVALESTITTNDDGATIRDAQPTLRPFARRSSAAVHTDQRANEPRSSLDHAQ